MAQSEKIIISVELRDQGVKSKSKKAKDSIDKLTDSSKKLAQAKKNLALAESEEGRELAALQIKTQLATQANRNLALATMATTKATKKGKTQTGLNNAIMAEAGRTASDAAYGMQGMANNLGQLLTLMSQHVETKGGFVASMKSLGKSMFGIGGILIALQLLISYLPQIIDYFNSFDSSKFVKSMNNNTESLRHMSKQLSDQNTSIEDRKLVLDTLKRTNRELYDLMVKDGKLQKDSNKTMSTYLKMLEEQERLKQKDTELTEEISDIEKKDFVLKEKLKSHDQKAAAEKMSALKRIKLAREQGFKLYEEYTQAELDSEGNIIQVRKTREVTEREYAENLLGRLRGERRGILKEIDDLNVSKDQKLREVDESQKRITKLRKELGLDEEKKTPKGTRKENIFLAKTLDYVSEIKKAKKIAASDDLLTERELLDNKQKLRREELKTELDLFLAKEKIRRDLFIADKNNTKAEKAKAEETYKNSVKNAQASYDVAIDFMKQAEEAEDNLLIRRIGEAGRSLEERQKIHDADIEAIRTKIERMKGLIDSEGGEIKGLILPKTREDLDTEVEDLEKEMEIKGAQLEMFKGDIEAKMILEKEYTDLNVELTEKRVNIAQIEQDSKAKFLQDSIGLLNSASKIAKKGTDTSKAFAIASTTVSTWDAAQKAYRSQMDLSPDAPIRAQIAWAAAVAKGTLNVKNIMAEKKPGGGSSGGGSSMPPVQAPDFNIIGSTGTNQLADAIGGTTQQPIKAYVVSSEVTSAQELDRNIVESASI